MTAFYTQTKFKNVSKFAIIGIANGSMELRKLRVVEFELDVKLRLMIAIRSFIFSTKSLVFND